MSHSLSNCVARLSRLSACSSPSSPCDDGMQCKWRGAYVCLNNHMPCVQPINEQLPLECHNWKNISSVSTNACPKRECMHTHPNVSCKDSQLPDCSVCLWYHRGCIGLCLPSVAVGITLVDVGIRHCVERSAQSTCSNSPLTTPAPFSNFCLELELSSLPLGVFHRWHELAGGGIGGFCLCLKLVGTLGILYGSCADGHGSLEGPASDRSGWQRGCGATSR